MDGTNGQSQHNTQTLCNTLWGQYLSFHPFLYGDDPIPFSSLLPNNKTFLETYRDASLEKTLFELCQLLVATNSVKSLECLLEQSVLQASHTFKTAGKVTLAHLVCAVGTMEMVTMLQQRCGSNSNGIWTKRDEEEHTAKEVCFSPDIRRNLPGAGRFHRSNKILVGQPLKQEDKDRIFQLATQHNGFYKVIVQLQMYMFDVNTVRNSGGDLLIHVAVKGGLPSLPLLCVLVYTFKADVNLQDGNGLTPLCLAAKLGQQKLAEVLVCVFGADINAADTVDGWSPLHYAVNYNQPKVVSMLVLRGADAGCEDKSHCDPSFLARKKRAHECRQIIQQHISERSTRLAAQAKDGSLKVDSLYTSDMCVVTNEGCTLLMLAVMNNRVQVVRDLVALPNCPLDFRQMKIVEGLVSSMSDSLGQGPPEQPPEPENSLKTAAHLAAERGHTKCLQLLFNAGAHPSMLDASIMIPLHYAVDNDHIECVKVIVNYSNQNLGLSGLRPAINIAEGNKSGEILTMLRDAYDRRQREVVTPRLFEVAHSGHKELIFQILENGDDMNPINECHDWPLLLAAGFGYLDIVIQLFEFGGHVTRHHKISRSTPLHVAARGGHKNTVEWLLQFCPNPHNKTPSLSQSCGEELNYLDINDRNAVMATPLELAATQGHSRIVTLLLEHGATTMLPDRDGRLVSCPAFAGTQFLIETYRKERLKKIVSTLKVERLQLRDFEKLWKGPSDFNLRKKNGDSVLMVAAEHAPSSVVGFLLESAKACRPGMLISTSGQPLPLPCPPSSSPEDNSEHHSERSLPTVGSVSQDARPYYYSSDEERPMTALPRNFRAEPRKTEGSVSSRVMRTRDRLRRSQGERPPQWRRRPSSPNTTDTSDDEMKMMNGHHDPTGNGASANSSTGLHTAIIRQASPHDGQTALHRAAIANQSENVALLLRADTKCANLQDNDGNTALHLACNKAHKPTIKMLLNFECVDSSLRNKKFEYPEHGCIKTNIKKMVCKHREGVIKRSLPSPPTPTPAKKPPSPPLPIASTVTNGYHHELSRLPPPRTTDIIHTSPASSSEPLAWSELDKRLEELKSRKKGSSSD